MVTNSGGKSDFPLQYIFLIRHRVTVTRHHKFCFFFAHFQLLLLMAIFSNIFTGVPAAAAPSLFPLKQPAVARRPRNTSFTPAALLSAELCWLTFGSCGVCSIYHWWFISLLSFVKILDSLEISPYCLHRSTNLSGWKHWDLPKKLVDSGIVDSV